ncbi:MAG: hypothetical protein GY821_14675 [Gammaproteobacteria bacterium]|nr:hypothetical protein [Gammaproteobacteria bacterium]
MLTEQLLLTDQLPNERPPPRKTSRPETFFAGSPPSPSHQRKPPPKDPPSISTNNDPTLSPKHQSNSLLPSKTVKPANLHHQNNDTSKQKITTSIINDRLVNQANNDNKPIDFIDLFKKPCWSIGKITLFDDLIRLLYQNSSIISFFMENGIGLDLSSLLSDEWWLYCIEGAVWLLVSALLLPKKHRKWFFKICRHYWSQLKNSCHAALAFISCFGASVDGIHSEYFLDMLGFGALVMIVHNICIRPYQNQIAELKNREFSNKKEFSEALDKVLAKRCQHYLAATLAGFITTFYRETYIIFMTNLLYGLLHHGQTLINLSHPIWLALYLPIAALGALLQCYLTNREIAIAEYMRDNVNFTREDALNEFKSINRIEKFLYALDRIKDTAKTLSFVLTLLTLTGLVPHIAVVVTIVIVVLLLKFSINRYYKSADDNQSSHITKQNFFNEQRTPPNEIENSQNSPLQKNENDSEAVNNEPSHHSETPTLL